MIKINKNDRITLNSMISKRYHNGARWTELSFDNYQHMNKLYHDWLLSHCRKGSKVYAKIDTLFFSGCKQCGLFNRLVYDTKSCKIRYIAGQDETVEIPLIKSELLKYWR